MLTTAVPVGHDHVPGAQNVAPPVVEGKPIKVRRYITDSSVVYAHLKSVTEGTFYSEVTAHEPQTTAPYHEATLSD